MRLGLLSAICIALVMLGGSPPAGAQMVREHDATTLRSFHGGPSRIKRSFKSDSEARAVLSQILAASGLAGMEDRILIRASAETANAEASIEKSERLIFYNALFMQQIAAKTGDYWSMVAILAHEVGHHVRLHTVIDGRAHEFELEADYHAGFVIRRMGGTLDQALGPFRTFPESDTPTHPGRAQRLQAVTLGWTDAGAVQTPAWTRPQQALPPLQPGPAQQSMAALDAKPTPPPPPQPAPPPAKPHDAVAALAPGSGKTAWARDTLADGSPCPFCPEMVVVPASKFTMGSPKGEKDRSTYEALIPVDIKRPLAVARFAVTRGEFAAFVEETKQKSDGGCREWAASNGRRRSYKSWRSPGFGQDDRHPVVCVDWNDAEAYAKWLSGKTGKPYRLLSETERENVTRAGTKTPFWWGGQISTAEANYNGAYTYDEGKEGEVRHATVAVDSFAANPWGLYNVHGNVFEWTADCWNDKNEGNPGDGRARATGDCSRRVVRGGSWAYTPGCLRSAFRQEVRTDDQGTNLGFRVGRTLP